MGELPNFLFRAYKLGKEILASASAEQKAEFRDLMDCSKAISRKIEIVLERPDVIRCLLSHEYMSTHEQLWTHPDLPPVVLLDEMIVFNNIPIRFSEWALNSSIEEYLEDKEENNA